MSAKTKWWCLLFLSFFLICTVNTVEANSNTNILIKKRVLYVPLDDRPVSLNYVVNTFKHVPVQFRVAPTELLSHRNTPGDVEEIWSWLRKEASAVDVMVIAADSLIYGGLVPSRRHELSAQVLNERVERIQELKKINPSLQIYLFTTIMRTPRASSGGTEPDYYEIWGPQIFRLTQLLDLEERGMLDIVLEEELNQLKKDIPQRLQDDWFQRRTLNRRINEHWISAAKRGFVDYLIICRDDSAQYSQSQREWRLLKPQTVGLPETRFHAFPGTDEVGMLLLTRAINDLTFKTPRIGVVYAPGTGGATIPSYEDEPIDNNINAHIYAMGGFPSINIEDSDLILLVNTPDDGKTLEANHRFNRTTPTSGNRELVRAANRWLQARKAVSIADVAFGNGSDRGLMAALEERKFLYQIHGYAGWNTAGNSLGYALSQGYLSKQFFSRNVTDRLLSVRYLDDWAYQSEVRGAIYNKVIYPNQIDGNWVGLLTPYVEANIERELQGFIEKHLTSAGAQKPVRLKKAILPWERMFEIEPILEEEK